MPIFNPTPEQAAWLRKLEKGTPVMVDGNRVRYFHSLSETFPEGPANLEVTPGGEMIGIDQYRITPVDDVLKEPAA